MAEYTLQGFTNDASSADLDATNLNEMDNAIKIGHDFADGASSSPSAGKAMVWPSGADGNNIVTLKKKYTGATWSTTGGQIVFSHGLTASKIVSIDCLIAGFPSNYTKFSGYQYNFWLSGSDDIAIGGINGNDENMLDKTYTVVIEYEV